MEPLFEKFHIGLSPESQLNATRHEAFLHDPDIEDSSKVREIIEEINTIDRIMNRSDKGHRQILNGRLWQLFAPIVAGMGLVATQPLHMNEFPLNGLRKGIIAVSTAGMLLQGRRLEKEGTKLMHRSSKDKIKHFTKHIEGVKQTSNVIETPLDYTKRVTARDEIHSFDPDLERHRMYDEVLNKTRKINEIYQRAGKEHREIIKAKLWKTVGFVLTAVNAAAAAIELTMAYSQGDQVSPLFNKHYPASGLHSGTEVALVVESLVAVYGLAMAIVNGKRGPKVRQAKRNLKEAMGDRIDYIKEYVENGEWHRTEDVDESERDQPTSYQKIANTIREGFADFIEGVSNLFKRKP